MLRPNIWKVFNHSGAWEHSQPHGKEIKIKVASANTGYQSIWNCNIGDIKKRMIAAVHFEYFASFLCKSTSFILYESGLNFLSCSSETQKAHKIKWGRWCWSICNLDVTFSHYCSVHDMCNNLTWVSENWRKENCPYCRHRALAGDSSLAKLRRCSGWGNEGWW